MPEASYWTRVLTRRLSRRQAIKGGTVAGLGFAGLTTGLGCTGSTRSRTQPYAQATPSAVAQPKAGGTLKFYFNNDPPHLDPHLSIATNLLLVTGRVYGRLMKKKAGPGIKPVDIVLIPDMAESFEQPDDLTYVFKLRKNIKWQNVPPLNGREFVAEDVVYSFKRLFRDGTPYRYQWEGELDKLEAPEKYTVKFVTRKPYAAFMDYVGSPFSGYVIPKEVLEADGDAKTRAIGTGPFILESYETGSGYYLKKNPDYFDARAVYLDRIDIAVIPDTSTCLAALRGKQLDVGIFSPTDLPPAQLDSLLKTNPDMVSVSWPRDSARGVTFDNTKAPFTDRRVRQAVALSIDREAVIRALYDGQGVAHGAIPSALGDWSVPVDQLGAGAKFYKRDVKEAKRLLAEAGFPNGFKTVMNTTQAYGDAFVQESEIVRGFLEEVGIQAEMKLWEYGAWLAGPIGGKVEGMVVDPLSGYEFPDPYLYGRYAPEQYYNRGRINDPKLTEMVTAQRRELNREKRKQTVHEIQRYMAEQCYINFLPVGYDAHVVQPFVKNFYPLNGRGREWLEILWLDK